MTTKIRTSAHRAQASDIHPELEDLGKRKVAPAIWAATRIGLGFIFLWAFVDKLLGLGFATPSERSWLNGGSPTAGYLAGVEGPFAGIFNALSGQAWADWLFMAGLLGIGVALMLGVTMRLAASTGALLLVFMYAASLPLENNPVIDDHLVYAVVLVGLAAVKAGDTFGLGGAWQRTRWAQRYSWLR